MRMNGTEVMAFLKGQRVYGLDPQSRKVAASIDYAPDGTCLARFVDGRLDAGVWGIEGDTYWTRYENFRDGKRHVFSLEPLGQGVAQAYFADGTIAFLQSHSETP